MEQVAEALKQFQTNGLWKAEVVSVITNIVEEVEEKTTLSIDDEQVLSILNAIISIYEKKAPVIEWHENKDQTPLLPPQKFDWEHDVTGELYDNMYFLEKRFPEHASKWADGVFGGNCFVAGDEKFYTTEATRGIGYTALIAFDQFGNGAVFVKDKL